MEKNEEYVIVGDTARIIPAILIGPLHKKGFFSQGHSSIQSVDKFLKSCESSTHRSSKQNLRRAVKTNAIWVPTNCDASAKTSEFHARPCGLDLCVTK